MRVVYSAQEPNLSLTCSSYWRFLFSYLSKLFCTTCLFISKSFKELFFIAFFSKADAKVRTIFELPKLFRENFQKSFFSGSSWTSSLFQYFSSSAFLSRKRVQNYCFTTYAPNFWNSFFHEKRIFFLSHWFSIMP